MGRQWTHSALGADGCRLLRSTWQGTIQDIAETRVALHTRTALVDRIIEQTISRHPFEVPGLVAVPLVAASPTYAQWIRDSTREPE